jgi:GR25 family glycosyltransferase involved in LPS biosynthesis
MFDRIVLVNLPRRADRLAAALEQLQPPAWPFGPPEIFAAVDGSKLPTPPGYQAGGGAWGCLQSHRQILERALLEGLSHILILEDDVVLRRDFKQRCKAFLGNLPAEYDGLMWGGQHHAAAEAIRPGVVRCINTQRTHAYSARRPWMEELYRMWCAPRMSTHCDWVMGPACRRFRIFAPDPFLIGQGSSHSDICGRDQPAKFWQPPTGEEPVILLRSQQPVVAELRALGWHTGYQRDPRTDYDVGLGAVVAGHKQLAEWIHELQWEVVSEEGWVLVIWHPRITLAEVRAAWPGPCLELQAGSAAEALAAYEAWRGRPAERSQSA